jgi:hypothetical protein
VVVNATSLKKFKHGYYAQYGSGEVSQAEPSDGTGNGQEGDGKALEAALVRKDPQDLQAADPDPKA